MCISISHPEFQPANTLLINMPVKLINNQDTSNYQMVFYLNTLKTNEEAFQRSSFVIAISSSCNP